MSGDALRFARRKLARTVLDAVPQVVYGTDREGRVRFTSAAWSEEAKARGVPELADPPPGRLSVPAAMTPETRRRFEEVYARLWAGGPPHEEILPEEEGAGARLRIYRSGEVLVHMVRLGRS